MDENGGCRGMCNIFEKNLFYLFSSLDINECLSNPCSNTMTCENTPGAYRCVEGCEPGYTWSLKHGECRGKIIDRLIKFYFCFSCRCG